MPGKKECTTGIVPLLAAAAIAISCSALLAGNINIFSKYPDEEITSEPTLYLARSDINTTEMLAADPNSISQTILSEIFNANSAAGARFNLVITTHGWIEKRPWPKDLALSIKSQINSQDWLCGWYDWRGQAKYINPTDAAKYGRDIAGPLLGKRITGLSKNYRHIHLIGHSAGSWVINEAAKVIARETNASIHLTFLDAYVPPFWDEDELGDFPSDPNFIRWADHYFTSDITLGATGKRLTNAHNVNLTDVTPGINDHQFPHYWYRNGHRPICAWRKV